MALGEGIIVVGRQGDIPLAVAGGTAGKMSGTDKAKLDVIGAAVESGLSGDTAYPVNVSAWVGIQSIVLPAGTWRIDGGFIFRGGSTINFAWNGTVMGTLDYTNITPGVGQITLPPRVVSGGQTVQIIAQILASTTTLGSAYVRAVRVG